MTTGADLQGSSLVIDSHVHLFAKSGLDDLQWQRPGHPLYDEYSVEQYAAAQSRITAPSRRVVDGFIFVEADRKTAVAEDDSGWDRAIEEVLFVSHIATSTQVLSDGPKQTEHPQCLAIVGWAPVPGGRSAMESYCRRVNRDVEAQDGGQAVRRVVGWRYLVQDKPKGTMLEDNFIDSLKWMGEKGFSFDLGIDFHNGGLWQLQEAKEMITRVVDGMDPTDCVTIIIGKRSTFGMIRRLIRIDHMGKPNLETSKESIEDVNEQLRSDPWSFAIADLAKFPNVFVKISGAFSEMEPLPLEADLESLFSENPRSTLCARALHILRWIDFVVQLFTVDRCMVASDWPICNISGGGDKFSLRNWMWIVTTYTNTLSERDQAQLWGATASKVYKVNEGLRRN